VIFYTHVFRKKNLYIEMLNMAAWIKLNLSVFQILLIIFLMNL